MDSGPAVPLTKALLTNAALLAVFALQHSIMARKKFKEAWTRIVPEPAERSTYVLASSAALMAMFYFWQPMGGEVWNVESGPARVALHAAYALGWIIVLLSTFMINHFDLFGLRQVWLYATGKPYTHLPFKTPFFYRYVRHPLYLGWLFCFWATPTMTVTHLFFAVMTTAYILIAIQFEERDLISLHGEIYRRYRRQVPMIVPVRAPIPETAALTSTRQPA
jgi:protein-S-isoprenylcysteine O-methyltransferase Ste14